MGSRYLIGAGEPSREITIDDCGTRSQLLAVETLIAIGVDVELVEQAEGITKPLRIRANGINVEILPYGRPEHRREDIAS